MKRKISKSLSLRSLALFAMLSGVVTVLGCEEPPPPPRKLAPKKTAAAPVPQTVAPPEEVKEPEDPYSYSPVGKRDPFRSYLADLEAQIAEDDRRPLGETERFELGQFTLTGIVTGTAQPKAMMEDPDGTGHVLRIGSRLGKRGGRVARITREGIVVVEEFRAPTGERIRVPIKIKLPQSDTNLLKY